MTKTIGFLGTGAISEAMIVGLMRSGSNDERMVVSPRNAAIASRLAKRFPEAVTVAPDNQSVLDASDVVVIAVRPQVVADIVPSLSFRPDHLVVSLVATVPIGRLEPWVAPATRVLRAIPLPLAAMGKSPTALMPPDPVARELFDRMGSTIEVADERAFDAFAAMTSVKSAHFAFAQSIVEWVAANGVEEADARTAVARILSGLAATGMAEPGSSFARLAEEHATPGGLNEQFRKHLEGKEAIFLAVLEAQGQEGLDGLLGRIDRAADTGEVIELLADWADSRSRSGGWSLTILEHARTAAQGSASMRRQEEIIRGHWRQLGERILPHLRDPRSGNPELLGALLHEIAYAPALTFVDKPTAGELMRLSMSALLRD